MHAERVLFRESCVRRAVTVDSKEERSVFTCRRGQSTLGDVFVVWSCCSKHRKLGVGGFKTAEMSSLSVLEARSSKPRCRPGHALSLRLQGRAHPCLFQLVMVPAIRGVPGLLARHSDLGPRCHTGFSLSSSRDLPSSEHVCL